MEHDPEVVAIERQIAELEERLRSKVPGTTVHVGRARRELYARISLIDPLEICSLPEPGLPPQPPKPEPSEPDSGEEMAQLRQRVEAHGQQLNRIEEQLRQITARLGQQGK